MRLPNLDPGGGLLSIDNILIDYDGPQFFVARNSGGSKFLGLHTASDRDIDQWLYVRVSNNRIKLLSRGHFAMRDAFIYPEYGNLALHRITADPEDQYFEDLIWLNPDDVGDDLLPDIDSYLPAPEIDEQKFEVAVQRAPAPVQAVVRRAHFPMWEFDPQIVELLRAYKTPPHVSAKVTKRSVVDMAFSVDKSRTDFPVRSLSAVLGVTQSLVDALAVDAAESNPRGPIPASIRGRTALDAVATFPSSFGLRLETSVGDIAGNGPVDIALQRLVLLLSAVNSPAEMQAALKTVSRRAQNHFKAFSKAIASGKADFKLEAASPFDESTAKVYISESKVRWLTKFLDAEVDSVERTFEFKGRLLAVSLKSKFFLLQNSQGEEISGRINKECLKKIDEKKVNVEHIATIVERTDVSEATGEETTKYSLTDIEEAT